MKQNKKESKMNKTTNGWSIHPQGESVASFTIIEKDGRGVAEVYGSDEEGQELATLFASSREMLEVLKKVKSYFSSEGLNPGCVTKMKKKTDELVARAEGK